MHINNLAVYEKQAVEKQDHKKVQGMVSKGAKQTAGLSDAVSVAPGIQNDVSGIYLPDGAVSADTDTVEAKQQGKETLAVLTDADYEELEKEEGSVLDANQESIERAVEKIKEQKAMDARQLQKSLEVREEFQEELERIQTLGFLSQKSEAQLRQIMEEAGIPVTEETLLQIFSALGMAKDALEMTDQSRAYLIEQQLEPTIENLYQGKHSAAEGQTMQNANAQEFSGYEEQIRKILESCGRLDETGMEHARWLFARELPIDETTLGQMEKLQEVSESVTMSKVLEQIFVTMLSGNPAKAANLDVRPYHAAKEAVFGFADISEEAIVSTAELAEKTEEEITINLKLLQEQQEKTEADSSKQQNHIPLVYTDDMTPQEILEVTLKRQLEEIRQKMTVQAAIRMEQKGISPDTESLEKIIEELRNIETMYYSRKIGMETEALADDERDLFQETLSKTADIANSHAALLGTGVRQRELLTVNELHAAVGSVAANRKEWQGVYETVATEVRTDLGDSIRKAFQGIPEILQDMGMENTEANERAVRILGYNGIALTEENISQVKLFDAKVNRMIENMKPSTVLELIHRGENPLEIPLDRLNEELEEINQGRDAVSDEKYSRYLWQLEKKNQITPEERAGYIGVYRLLSQIEKSDGAVIGAVMETEQELTLGNLLKQARTRKGSGIDYQVGETTGLRESVSGKSSITDQIALGFSQHQQDLVSKTLEEMTPSKLEEMTDGHLERLLGLSLEELYDGLSAAQDDETLNREYYQEKAAELREIMEHSGTACEFLEKMQAESTVGNILIAKMMLEEGYSVYQEFYDSRKKLTKEEREELEETVDSFDESMEDEEALNAQCAKSEKIMEKLLTKSSERADISFEEFRKFQQIKRGIRLEGVFRSSHSYDIPIRTGDGITSLNLTIVRGADESGRIQVSMEDEEFGNIAMDFKASNESVKGLVLCDRRQGFDALQAQQEALAANLEYAGFQVKNISYGMDFKSRNELLTEAVQAQEAETGRLYQIAKILVRSAAAVIQRK